MKKVILSVFLAGSLLATSCKKAKEAKEEMKETTEQVVEKTEEVVETTADETEEAVEEVSEAMESAIEGITIPDFNDPKVAEHLKAYSEYAQQYIDAGKDAYKNAEIVKKGEELAAKTKEIVANLDEEAKKKFNAVMTKIQSKMAPASK